MSKSKGIVIINVGGRNIPVRICLYSIEAACDTLGLELETLAEKLEGLEKGKTKVLWVTKLLSELLKEGANYELDSSAVPYEKRNSSEWVQELGVTNPALVGILTELGGVLADLFKNEIEAKKKATPGPVLSLKVSES